MLKVTFKEPLKFWININSNEVKDMSECLFCFTCEPIEFLERGIKIFFSKEKWDFQVFSFFELKSIEQVKPTDL